MWQYNQRPGESHPSLPLYRQLFGKLWGGCVASLYIISNHNFGHTKRNNLVKYVANRKTNFIGIYIWVDSHINRLLMCNNFKNRLVFCISGIALRYCNLIARDRRSHTDGDRRMPHNMYGGLRITYFIVLWSDDVFCAKYKGDLKGWKRIYIYLESISFLDSFLVNEFVGKMDSAIKPVRVSVKWKGLILYEKFLKLQYLRKVYIVQLTFKISAKNIEQEALIYPF